MSVIKSKLLYTPRQQWVYLFILFIYFIYLFIYLFIGVAIK